MIYIKSDKDIITLRKCGTVLAKMYEHIEPYIQPGISAIELDKIAESFILDNGTIPVQKGYKGFPATRFPATLCVSRNEEVIHGIPGNKIIKEGDIVSLDCTIGLDGLLTDSAKTYPVGKVKKEYQLLIERTETALYKGIEVSKHNMRINDIGKSIEKYISTFGYGIVRDYCGHGIGANIHEEPAIPNYYSILNRRRLKENMVFTIEPMINIGSHEVDVLDDEWTVVTSDKSYSCHFEHTIVLTKEGYEILTVVD